MTLKNYLKRVMQSLSSVVFMLVCFVIASPVRAVVPAPDGGYSGFNTAEGQNALFNLTTGVGNTAVGWFSLWSDTDGSYNTALGAGTLLFNIGDQSTGDGTQNTAVGTAALLFNTTGFSNTAVGVTALLNNTEGGNNTAIGEQALYSNTIGFSNTANGTFALFSNTDGEANTATGSSALLNNTSGFENTATGDEALSSNTTGHRNTATGVYALNSNSTGNGNTAYGHQALVNNSTGNGNTANGFSVLFSNTTGDFNTANGDQALAHNTTGAGNTANGNQALYNNTTGSYNVALNGGYNLTTGNFNIAIANDGVAGESNTTRIGILQNRCFISGIREVQTGNADAIPVLIDSAGQLGTVSSSRRFKKEIKPMNQASEAILALKPVTFHYKSDKTWTPQFGLIAEEVAAVNPDLVVRDDKGEIYTVRYDAVNAMLLNEFLKEHRKVQDLEKGMAAVAAQLKEQAAQIQKVSAHLEMSKPATSVVLNNP